MPSIDIDDEVYNGLSRRAVGFYLTPNDVLRRVLELPEALLAESIAPASDHPQPTPAAQRSTDSPRDK